MRMRRINVVLLAAILVAAVLAISTAAGAQTPRPLPPGPLNPCGGPVPAVPDGSWLREFPTTREIGPAIGEACMYRFFFGPLA